MSKKPDRPLDDRDSLLLGWVEDELTPEQAARFEVMCKTDASLARLAEQMKADRAQMCRMPAVKSPEDLWKLALEASERPDAGAVSDAADQEAEDFDEVLRFPGRSSVGGWWLLRGALAASLLIVGSVAMLQLADQRPGEDAGGMVAMRAAENDAGHVGGIAGETGPSEPEIAAASVGRAAEQMDLAARGRDDMGLEKFADESLADRGTADFDLPVPSSPVMPLPAAEAAPSAPPPSGWRSMRRSAMLPAAEAAPSAPPPSQAGLPAAEAGALARREEDRAELRSPADLALETEPGGGDVGVAHAEPGVAMADAAPGTDGSEAEPAFLAMLDDDPVVAALMTNLSMHSEPYGDRAAGLERSGRVVLVVESPDVGQTVQDMSRWAFSNNVAIHAQRQVDPLELETARNRLEQVVIQRSTENAYTRNYAGRADESSQAQASPSSRAQASHPEEAAGRVVRGQSRVVDREEVAEVRRDLIEAMHRNQMSGGRVGQVRAHPITVEIEPEQLPELFAQIPRDQAMTVMIEGAALNQSAGADWMRGEAVAGSSADRDEATTGDEIREATPARPGVAADRVSAELAERAVEPPAGAGGGGAWEDGPAIRRLAVTETVEGLPQSTVVTDDRGVTNSLRMNSQMWQTVLNRAVLNQQMRAVPAPRPAAPASSPPPEASDFERQRSAPGVADGRVPTGDAPRNVVIEILVVPSRELDQILEQRGR